MHAIMCSNNDTALVPYGLACKSLTDTTTTVSSQAASASAAAAAAAYVSLAPGGVTLTQAALEHYRLQLYNYAYADRFRFTHPALAAAVSSPFQLTAGYAAGLAHDASPQAFSLSPYSGKFDPRAYRLQEEPKPQHSYIGLIGMAILNSPDKKLVLSDIYQYILDNYAYFRSRGPGWRNSIRHNLSLNDCFIKAGRSANGKGHYWAIHPANIEDFKKGDFRRRKAQRRVRKHMGLAVPDDEDSTSPPPNPPQSIVAPARGKAPSSLWADMTVKNPVHVPSSTASSSPPIQGMAQRNNKRQFDMESLLAPDPDPKRARLRFQRAVATCAARTDAECCEDETCNQDQTRSASGRGDGDSDSDSDGQSPRLLHHNINQRVSLQNHHQANGGPCSRTLWSLAQCNSIPGQNAWSVPVPVPVPVSKPFAYALSSAAAGSSCWAALSAAAAAAAAAAANNPLDLAENNVADADERSVAESTSASTTWMGC